MGTLLFELSILTPPLLGVCCVLGKNLYYHSGGPGIILSNNCLMKLQPFLNTMTEKWLTIWEKSKKYFIVMNENTNESKIEDISNNENSKLSDSIKLFNP